MPTTADDLTPAWLSDALGVAVAAVEPSVVGTGQMGDSVRLNITYDAPTDLPPSLVAKLPASDPKSRATAAAIGNYRIEVSFYRELAPLLPVRAPHCFFAHHDAATDDFVLLLEDMAPAQQGDQLAGCTPDQAAIAVDELPKLHAPKWGDPALDDIPWLSRKGETTEGSTMLISGLFHGFRERYAERLDPDVLTLSERFIAHLPKYIGGREGPMTVVHGDYRLDNLLFGTSEGGPPVAVVDWQTVTLGPGVSDLSHFIGAGLLPDDRRKHEEDLVRAYHAGVNAAGVDLDWDTCWRDYRRYTFAGLMMAIAASMLVVQTERGDDMFVTMAQRHGRHALDLDAETLLH